MFDSLCFTVKKGNIKASNILCKVIGLHNFERRVQWTSYFPSMAILIPKIDLTRADFDHVLGNHVWTVGSHNQQNKFSSNFTLRKLLLLLERNGTDHHLISFNFNYLVIYLRRHKKVFLFTSFQDSPVWSLIRCRVNWNRLPFNPLFILSQFA